MEKTGFGEGLKYRSGKGMETPRKNCSRDVGHKEQENFDGGGERSVLERGSERYKNKSRVGHLPTIT